MKNPAITRFSESLIESTMRIIREMKPFHRRLEVLERKVQVLEAKCDHLNETKAPLLGDHS